MGTDPERPEIISLQHKSQTPLTALYNILQANICHAMSQPRKKIHAAFPEFLQNEYFSLTKNFRYPFQMRKFSPKIVSGILTSDFLPRHLDPTMWNHMYSTSSTEPQHSTQQLRISTVTPQFSKPHPKVISSTHKNSACLPDPQPCVLKGWGY